MAQSISRMPEYARPVGAHAPVVEPSRDAIAAVQSRFPLRVVLSGKGGEYIVADSLTVRDKGHELVTISEAGPLVLLNVPPGRYTVEASYQGKTRQTTVVVGSEPRMLNWIGRTRRAQRRADQRAGSGP